MRNTIKHRIVYVTVVCLLVATTVTMTTQAITSKKRVAAASQYGDTADRIVGAWRLEAVGAPILHHFLTFHNEGTVQSFQADGGYPSDSESPGAGVWKAIGYGRIKGYFEEYQHDRDTHEYLGYARIDFTIQLSADGLHFTGTATSHVFDAQGSLIYTATPQWSASRMTI